MSDSVKLKKNHRPKRITRSLPNTIDGFVKRLDEVETEQTARDAKFERLTKWAEEVSEKTGIHLLRL